VRLQEQQLSVEDLSKHRYISLIQDGSAAEAARAAIDCNAHPLACREPLNCHLPMKEKAPGKPLATRDGHADFSTWCDNANYIDGATACYYGKLNMYGTLMYQAQLRQSKTILGIDAHYCFAYGHCDNEAITPNTTLKEAEAMCDDVFGDTWKKTDGQGLVTPFDVRLSKKGVFLSKGAEKRFATMACAMGNYHCDAIYCKQEYCGKEEWRARYDQFRPKEARERHGADYPKNF